MVINGSGRGTPSPGSLLQVGTDDGSTVSDGTIRIGKSVVIIHQDVGDILDTIQVIILDGVTDMVVGNNLKLPTVLLQIV